MYRIVCFTIFLCFGMGFAQHPGGGYCTLLSENKAWFYEFGKTELLDDQIELIVNKITADTDYFVENPEIANLDDRRVMGTVPCVTNCSVRFVLVYGKGKGIVLDVKKNPEFEDLLYELSADNIKKIDLNVRHASDRYNHKSPKRSGVVLYTEDKALKKMIRRALKDIEKSEG